MSDNPAALRLIIFAAVMLAFIGLETIYPARPRIMARARRWRTNLSLSVLGSLVGVIAAPILALSMAALAAQSGWGLFNMTTLPIWLEVALAVILLDFAIWAQHVAFHYVPWLWRLHSVHHTDRDLDATTGVRFHPVEIGLSLLWKAGVILALGPAVLAVLIFEIVLNAGAIFTHSNIALPPRLDRLARLIFVTPDMHRIHHSVIMQETNSNFGFNLSIWDRLLRTYRAQNDGELTLGLSEHQNEQPAKLLTSLYLPFTRRPR